VTVPGVTSTRAPIGVLGGSFDPVHHGHLRAALEVVEACALAGMRLIPVGQPPHRQPPVASAEERLRMLRAAAAAESRFNVDEREIRRIGPSYTVDTLRELRAEVGGQPICLVLGADAFLGLPTWHRWCDLPELAHIIVMHRPGVPLVPGTDLAELLAARRRDTLAELTRGPAGTIRVQPVTQLDISSSAIRALVNAGGDPRYLVPDAVRDLLMKSGCYRKSAEVQVRA
jgi:nicotinate-nucleotide adenylyltransferase